jgi:hypothetical protein
MSTSLRWVIIASLLFFGASSLYSQQIHKVDYPALTPDEQFRLSLVPPLEVPARYKGPDAPLLPYMVDNSTQPYFRAITTQSGYECGQSAGIAFNYTYEVDRLRGVPANTPVTTYPTHFAWDFLNNGDNYTGASCFDGWEIVRACGTMNVADYGGQLNTGGYKRWISGYNYYYNGMANRINYQRSIRCNTPEGLQTLKYWLHDHLEGSSVGGLANFYGQYFTPTKYLPAGTPEGGKCVQPGWATSPSHTWTICGYNDSIRYDYNGDGQYTNDVDINGDGVVDMHDWEIGGIKLASGNAGTGWGNGGFCYTMYKCLADAVGYGGIWNNTGYVINTKVSCSPKLTLKITLKHNSRNKIKVNAGVSANLSATVPSTTLDFPIFNFEGGDNYMQGGTTEADKTIEFGLDITPLLSELTSGQPAKWFLQVQEADPGNLYTGEITSWSLIDYTSGTAVETPYPSNNVTLLNNAVTRLSLNYTVNFNKPAITNSSLPTAYLYQPYSVQLASTGGTSPYRYDTKIAYPETVSTNTYPGTSGQPLTLLNNNTGYVTRTLPFSFPFYNRTVNKIYIYADGYIVFDDQPFTWPFLVDKSLLFKETSIIAPFIADLCVYPSQGQGIWYREDPGSVTIFWKTSIYNMASTTSLNFSVRLGSDGKIEFNYGTMTLPAAQTWMGGISGGDNRNYQFSAISNSNPVAANTFDQYLSPDFPTELSLSEDGLFSGTPVHNYQNIPVTFRVTDNNNISSLKTLPLSTGGIMINYTVNSGGDTIIEYGETAGLSLSMNNIGANAIHNIVMSITEDDPYITLNDSTESPGTINSGQTLNIANAFSFTVAQNVPDNHVFTIQLHFASAEQNYTRSLAFTAFAPDIRIGNLVLDDGDNGQLDPGETANLIVTFENHGGAKASSVNIQLASLDSLITLNSSAGAIGLLKPDSAKAIAFSVTGANTVPFQHLFLLNASINASNNYAAIDTLYLFSGEIIEDYETGNLNKFSWFWGGDAPWGIDTYYPWEGLYDTRSGWIFDNMESSTELNVNVLANGRISFWKRVSCEHDPSGNKNYDWLAFYIDHTEMGRWDGEINWSKETYPVTAGRHTFRWLYHKDYSVSYLADCAWIDFITFPIIENALPELNASPLSFTKSLETGQSAVDTLFITNTGGTLLNYSVIVFDSLAKKDNPPTDNLAGTYMECYSDGFLPGQPFSWTFVMHNQSPDNEYIKHAKMDFPPGVTVNTATNFSGGSLGDLVFQGGSGNGASLNWHGTSTGNHGVVKSGETASSLITGTIPENFTSDVFAVFSLKGDSTGNPAHDAPGYVRLANFGLANSWLSLENFFGKLYHNQTDSVILHFNTQNLPAGTYSCLVIAKDFYNNKTLIPVTVTITDPVSRIRPSEAAKSTLTASPNPVQGMTRICYSLPVVTNAKLVITDMLGKEIRTLVRKEQSPGEYTVIWDGRDDAGNPAANGIYHCILKTNDGTGNLKLILAR